MSRFYSYPEATQSACPFCKAVPVVVVVQVDSIGRVFTECHVCHARYYQKSPGSVFFVDAERQKMKVTIEGLPRRNKA